MEKSENIMILQIMNLLIFLEFELYQMHTFQSIDNLE